ncbi:flagellar hook-length control protein FliK, partial [Dermatophilus congolensis]
PEPPLTPEPSRPEVRRPVAPSPTPEQQSLPPTSSRPPAETAPPAQQPAPTNQATPAQQTQGISATTAPSTTTPTSSAPAPMVSAPPVPLYQQLVTGVSPMLRGVDGQYALMLQLTPVNLGHVQLQVSVKSGQVSIHVKAVDAATGQLVEENLDDLKQTLEQLGVKTGSIDVSTGESGDAESFEEAFGADSGWQDSSTVTTGNKGATTEIGQEQQPISAPTPNGNDRLNIRL